MPDIACAILRQFASFAEVYLGISHPFYQFCQLLAAIDHVDLVDAIQAAVSSIRDGFVAALGPFHRTALAARYTYICTVTGRHGSVA